MERRSLRCKPEVWGGIECTINRTGDIFRDQLNLTGHYDRTDDIDRIAELGFKKIRYPVLWERHQKTRGGPVNFAWVNGQLEKLRRHNMTPIIGLLHHGSGPVWTNLLDETFPEQLAAYSRTVAMHFPWVDHYTPINEPLTTARFSGLYGFWYPHHQKDNSFLKMLLLQVKAIVLSMKAIRRVNPNAKLIQTEDLSKTHSTHLLSYQANFENERRWLTYDLLCGKVNQRHVLWNFIISNGISERDLLFFICNPCPPDILGLNYYVTSERWLDENLLNYPNAQIGGNELHTYVDIEAVRANQMEGLDNLIEEVHERFRLPMAVTECHIACTEDEQARWLKESWDAACNAGDKGIPVRAVTAWSLLGAFDWDSLLTADSAHYEPGVFDVGQGYLRPTLLYEVIQSLIRTGDYRHPLLATGGWWNQPAFAL